MGHGALRKLDEESRALLGSWDDIARITVHVALLAAFVWSICALLRWAVHETQHALFHQVHAEGALWGPLVLLGVLLAG
ncbi:MAG: chloride channel protein, partial [Myxococcales bacterium]|nr:chloride channel protein [Myxococcales bacterium]